MADKKKKPQHADDDLRKKVMKDAAGSEPPEEQEAPGENAAEDAGSAPEEAAAPETEEQPKKLSEAEDKFLRLAAEYDNYRKRTAKEKESAWLDSKIQTVSAFLPVYDNLERALKQECSDEAYAKGVEMIMKGLQDVLAKLGVEVIPALGETFDPNRHDAVMHVDDENTEENTVVEVFQQGFLCGEKVIRFAMVKVAN